MIYDFVVQYMGTLPPHLTIIYDILTLFFTILIPITLIFPLFMLFKGSRRKGLL